MAHAMKAIELAMSIVGELAEHEVALEVDAAGDAEHGDAQRGDHDRHHGAGTAEERRQARGDGGDRDGEDELEPEQLLEDEPGRVVIAPDEGCAQPPVGDAG